jgi:hypothetical protein
MPAVSAPVEAAGALRHDPLQAHLARLGEDERALCLDRLAEEDVLDAGDEPRQRLPPVRRPRPMRAFLARREKAA